MVICRLPGFSNLPAGFSWHFYLEINAQLQAMAFFSLPVSNPLTGYFFLAFCLYCLMLLHASIINSTPAMVITNSAIIPL
jgi:hypothetical protein